MCGAIAPRVSFYLEQKYAELQTVMGWLVFEENDTGQ